MPVPWNPEIDPPATIAVIGAGPIGVEAALYGRLLGYFVLLLERGRIGHNLLSWSGHAMPGVWQEMVSPLGLAALEAQAGPDAAPPLSEPVTYREYVDHYLTPLAKTDLLYESTHVHTHVKSISRHLGSMHGSPEQNTEREFRLLLDSKQRGEYSQLVDVVFDCSGLNFAGAGLASGGGLASGQLSASESMANGKVDVLGKRRGDFAGKHCLLFGNNLTAAANALDFAKLIVEEPSTRLTWAVPRLPGRRPLELSLPSGMRGSSHLQDRVQRLLQGEQPGITPVAVWGIESVQKVEQAPWNVTLQVGQEETLAIHPETLINCASCLPDWHFATPLAIQLQTPASEIGSATSDLGAPTETSPDSASTPAIGWTNQPHYYVLGQKQVGPERLVSIPAGLKSIRETFALLGGRRELNLYASIKSNQ